MEKVWKQVYQNQISIDNTSNINIRVSATPDGVGVITDIRKYIGTRATRHGVGLFAEELLWVLECLKKEVNNDRQFDFRRVKLEFSNLELTITVLKSDWTEQKMYLDKHQVESILEIENVLREKINEAMQLVE